MHPNVKATRLSEELRNGETQTVAVLEVDLPLQEGERDENALGNILVAAEHYFREKGPKVSVIALTPAHNG